MSLCKETGKNNTFKKFKTLTLQFQKAVFEQQFYSCLLLFFKSIQKNNWAVEYYNLKIIRDFNFIKEYKAEFRTVSKIGPRHSLDCLYCLNRFCSLWHSFVLDTLIKVPLIQIRENSGDSINWGQFSPGRCLIKPSFGRDVSWCKLACCMEAGKAREQA